MRRLGLLVLLLVFPVSVQAAGDVPKKQGNLYSLSLNYEPSNGWDFLPRGYERTILDQTTPFFKHVYNRQLNGKQTTHKALKEGLAWLVQNATANDLVVVYIACHGNCVNGESVFHIQDGPVHPREIKKELAKLPCHAIVVDDACQSGNWPKERPNEPMPPNVTALCCCLPSQNSGFEFDITLFEALYGRADFNHDGVVDLDEVIRYCGLRIKEVQGGRLTPVLHKAKTLQGSPLLAKVAPNLVAVVQDGEMWSGLLEKQSLDGNFYHVRIIGYSSPANQPTNVVTRDYLCLPEDGKPVMVKQKSKWYPACLLSQKGEDYTIRYLGSKKGEEVVKADKVRHLFAGKPGEKFPLSNYTGQEAQPSANEARPQVLDSTLEIGDVAPKLDVKEFVKGKPVTEFEKKKTYVVGFWSTWCTPCRMTIPHLTELQKKNPDVTFIGVSVAERDPNKVKPFVEEMGTKMDFRVAVDSIPEGKKASEGAMVSNWMTRAGQDSIPTVFIIDDEGKIAWIGDPSEMEEPLEKIRDGKWDVAAVRAKRKAMKVVEKAVKGVEELGGRCALDEDSQSIAAIDFSNTKITDADMKKLKEIEGLDKLKNVQQLILINTKVADNGLKELKDAKNLQVLFMGGTKVTDAGLKELSDLQNLQQLGLARTKVTDAGLKEFKGLKNLKVLFLTQTKVTNEGREKLKKSMPKLEIY